MIFSIHDIAKEYISKRYPRASILEKEKYVNDWDNKIKDSKFLVADFKERIADPRDKKILDAGCGNGGISVAFTMAGAEVYGVEIEDELFEIAKKHANSFNLKPNFYLYDGMELPFKDNFFDYAVSASVLEHTDDPVFYLSEILRTIKPNGVLYLGFPNKLAWRETHTQLLFLTYLPAFLRPSYIKLFGRNPLKDNNLHFYGYFDLKKMLKKVNNKNKTGSGWKLINEKGASQNLVKKMVKGLLGFWGISYKVFLPHVLVILKKSTLELNK